jgi:photosystem II stability/assembly factor-like uncharacterized protein
MNSILSACLVALMSLPAVAAEPDWQPMLNGLPAAEKAGFGGLCGVCVDRATGDVVINISDRGFFRSDDGAKSFRRLGDAPPKGRTESPGCLHFDPTGKSKTLLTALVYGAPAGLSTDGGATWTLMEKAVTHVDWCAVDWTDAGRVFVLALKHESGGLLLASHDGGKSFAEVGKGFGPGWIFDAKSAVVAEARTKDRPDPGLLRTTDGGKSWQPCGRFRPVGTGSAQVLPRWHDGALYWLTDAGLISTADEGETWKTVAAIKDGRFGPVVGKSAAHLFVLTGRGIVETTDGGGSWSDPIPLPKGVGGGLTWVDYDPKGDTLYAMRMGSDLFKLARKK